MASDVKNEAPEQGPLTLLRQEVGRYLSARATHMVRNAGGKLADASERLAEDANGGALPKAGAKILRGEESVTGAVKETVKDTAKEKVKGAVSGKAKDVTDKAKEALPGGDSQGGGGGATDLKATTVIEEIDVGVPLRTAYDHWTEYERFSGFTKGVQEAKRGDEATSEWRVKVGPSTRTWKATVQEQIPDDRIVWTSEGGQGTTEGAVSFHELAPTLTRIILVLVYHPTGFVEKTGNIWRAQGRRARLDFKNFQRYVTFADEEAEGWRGEIRDAEVVSSHEDAMAEEQKEKEAEEREDQEEQEGAGEEGAEDEEGEEGAEQEEEEEEEPEDENEDAEETPKAKAKGKRR